MREIKNKLPDKALYSDVISGGHLLPEKAEYGMSDYRKLVKEGWGHVDARWIGVCSSIYYGAKCNDDVMGSAFCDKCCILDMKEAREREAEISAECDRLANEAMKVYAEEHYVPAGPATVRKVWNVLAEIIKTQGIEAARARVVSVGINAN